MRRDCAGGEMKSKNFDRMTESPKTAESLNAADSLKMAESLKDVRADTPILDEGDAVSIKENKLLGCLGLVLGGVFTTALYMVIGILRFWPWIGSAVGYYFSHALYRKFAGHIGRFGAVLSYLVTTFAIFTGILGIWSWHIYKTARISSDTPFLNIFFGILPRIFEEPNFVNSFVADVLVWGGISLFLGLVITVGLTRSVK